MISKVEDGDSTIWSPYRSVSSSFHEDVDWHWPSRTSCPHPKGTGTRWSCSHKRWLNEIPAQQCVRHTFVEKKATYPSARLIMRMPRCNVEEPLFPQALATETFCSDVWTVDGHNVKQLRSSGLRLICRICSWEDEGPPKFEVQGSCTPRTLSQSRVRGTARVT